MMEKVKSHWFDLAALLASSDMERITTASAVLALGMP
jgi:hypothetical protein